MLTPGLFARVRITGSGQYKALLLPDEAFGTDQTQRFAFVVNDQNTVEYRQVELGPIIDGLRVVRNGLQAGGLGDRERRAAGEARRQGRCRAADAPRGPRPANARSDRRQAISLLERSQAA